MTWEIRQGDALGRLREMPNELVQCCVTSPPYWGLRDYGIPPTVWPAMTYTLPGGEIELPEMECCLGLEPTPEQFVGHLTLVMREVFRALRSDGTLWLNLGDSYAGGGCGARDPERWPKQSRNDHMPTHAKRGHGRKTKDLIGVPWLVAFALQADGWYLRAENIWHKLTPMPESVTDRTTRAHEQVFLLSKSARYFYDADAVRTPLAAKTLTTFGSQRQQNGGGAVSSSRTTGRATCLTAKPSAVRTASRWGPTCGRFGHLHRGGSLRLTSPPSRLTWWSRASSPGAPRATPSSTPSPAQLPPA